MRRAGVVVQNVNVTDRKVFRQEPRRHVLNIFVTGRLPARVQFALAIQFQMSFAIESANPVVKAVIEGTAPRPARLAAARGILPLPQLDLLEVLVAFAGSDDAELSRYARETIRTHDTETLNTLVQSDKVPVPILTFLATVGDLPQKIHESIITNAKTPVATIVKFAGETKSAELLDAISLNQQLLVETPASSTRYSRIRIEHRMPIVARRKRNESFFEKERGQQQIANELRAQGKEAAAEFIENADFEGLGISEEDALFLADHIVIPDSETDDSWLGLEFIEELYEETAEQRQAIVNKILGEFSSEDMDLPTERISIINRIMMMGMKDRVRLAMKGDRESRNILIRDPNRIVAQAVVANPRITEQEIEKIASMRTVTEEILRMIASSRQWSRSYAIVHNLARNPRTPIANCLNILSRLQMKDLVSLSKNRNVSDAIRRQALAFRRCAPERSNPKFRVRDLSRSSTRDLSRLTRATGDSSIQVTRSLGERSRDKSRAELRDRFYFIETH
jgi:hypothetical protein